MNFFRNRHSTRRTPQEQREKRRVFLCAFGLSLAGLILVIGLITADYRCRRMSFGETALPVSILTKANGKTALRLRFFALDAQADITPLKNLFDFCCDFCCIPHG